ncbi:hypothetical protein TNCV_2178891 [Trichonephila clavipes]|uniref:Uncharacterized protein n=1 Tax=Trichonephila clavipes TaxID=2585209 RepID=A0A8X6VUA7_TRICX|nr:hypothetical protein TNCV_2178891 [Trichonephila clavipes]
MDSLGHSSLSPTDLGRHDEEGTSGTELGFITKDRTLPVRSHSSLSEVGKNPIDNVYDGVNGRCLNGRRLLIPASDSRIRMVSFVTTGCLEGRK